MTGNWIPREVSGHGGLSPPRECYSEGLSVCSTIIPRQVTASTKMATNDAANRWGTHSLRYSSLLVALLALLGLSTPIDTILTNPPRNVAPYSRKAPKMHVNRKCVRSRTRASVGAVTSTGCDGFCRQKTFWAFPKSDSLRVTVFKYR